MLFSINSILIDPMILSQTTYNSSFFSKCIGQVNVHQIYLQSIQWSTGDKFREIPSITSDLLVREIERQRKRAKVDRLRLHQGGFNQFLTTMYLGCYFDSIITGGEISCLRNRHGAGVSLPRSDRHPGVERGLTGSWVCVGKTSGSGKHCTFSSSAS